jgi:hypothetical protein
MNFNEYIIDQDDYDFFASLPKDEKILFLYDLICVDAYGVGSEDPEFEDHPDFETDIEHFKDRLSSIITGSINPEAKVNVLIVNNKIILNSNSLELLNEAITEMFMDGCVMVKYKLADAALKIFKQQEYCKAFTLLGRNEKISIN